MDSIPNTVQVEYQFTHSDGTKQSYRIEFDEATARQINKPTPPYPEWTRLENQKCAHCPLTQEESPYCPVALNLSFLVEYFKNSISHQKLTVNVLTADRSYVKELSLQDAIYSIFGLIMPLSDCPYTEFLKPMARFHLPFSSAEETIVRSVAFYLLKQYFVSKQGGTPDYTLAQMETHYANLQKVNLGIISRLRNIGKKDADVNAMVVLHAFSQILPRAISKDLSSIEHWFIPKKTIRGN